MRRALAVAKKETRHLLRDPLSLGAALALPVVLLLLYGYAVDLDLHDLPFVAVDQDHSVSSRRLIDSCAAIDSFQFLGLIDRADDAEREFELGEALVVLVIPPDFEQRLLARRTAPVQLLVDGADGSTAAVTLGYATGAVTAAGRRMVAERALAAGVPRRLLASPLEVRARYFYNPELKSRQFLIPGLIGVILMLLAALLTSGVVVRERERGSFELLAASPVRPVELILGKLAPYFVLASFDILLAVGLGWWVFGVVPQGSLLLLFALSLIFVVAALAIGLLFSCLARTQQTAMLLSFMVTVVPTMLLSGFAFPVRNMPVILQWLSQIHPATHYIAIARAVILKGVGPAAVLRPTLALTAIAGVLILLAVSRFRKTL